MPYTLEYRPLLEGNEGAGRVHAWTRIETNLRSDAVNYIAAESDSEMIWRIRPDPKSDVAPTLWARRDGRAVQLSSFIRKIGGDDLDQWDQITRGVARMNYRPTNSLLLDDFFREVIPRAEALRAVARVGVERARGEEMRGAFRILAGLAGRTKNLRTPDEKEFLRQLDRLRTSTDPIVRSAALLGGALEGYLTRSNFAAALWILAGVPNANGLSTTGEALARATISEDVMYREIRRRTFYLREKALRRAEKYRAIVELDLERAQKAVTPR